jgi:ribulose-5-phosphate 4-epimerase/fuculose-1-phosphate aldolase
MTSVTPAERQARVDLAAAFRWAARLNWHEAVANHFSVAVSEDRHRFLLNPRGRHFSRMRASELLLLDARDEAAPGGPGGPDPTAWYLHGQLHLRLPQARCVLHTHAPQVSALGCLKDFELLMLDQNACRFHRRIAYDRNFDGMALDAAEGARVAALLGADKSVLMMGNHGVLVIGESVAQAFDELYYLECAARLQILALATGRELALIPDAVAARTCAQWRTYPTDLSRLHFDALKGILDEEEPDYRR